MKNISVVPDSLKLSLPSTTHSDPLDNDNLSGIDNRDSTSRLSKITEIFWSVIKKIRTPHTETESKNGSWEVFKWWDIFKSVWKLYQSIHDTQNTSLNHSMESDRHKEIINTAERIRAIFMEKTKSFITNNVLFYFFERTFERLSDHISIFQVALTNVISHINNKKENLEDILDKLETSFVSEITNFFKSSNLCVTDGVIDEAALLKKMRIECTLPEAVYPLTQEEIALLSQKNELLEKEESLEEAILRIKKENPLNKKTLETLVQIQELESKINKHEYNAVKIIVQKFVNNIVFPGEAPPNHILEMIRILNKTKTLYNEKLEACLIKKNELEKKENSNFISKFIIDYKKNKLDKEIKSLQKNLDLLKNIPQETEDFKNLIAEIITKKIIEKIDSLSDPVNFCNFLAQRIKPNLNTVVERGETTTEVDTSYKHLFLEGAEWIFPQSKTSIQSLVDTASKSSKVVSWSLSFLPTADNSLQSTQEKSEETWYELMISAATTLALPLVGVAKQVEKISVEKLNKIGRPHDKLKNVAGALRRRVISNLTETVLLDKLDKLIKPFENPSQPTETTPIIQEESKEAKMAKAKADLKAALKARFSCLETLRQENGSLDWGTWMMGLSDEREQLKATLKEDPDFDKFIDRTLSNKRLNKLLIHKILAGAFKGLEEANGFRTTD